MNACEVCGQNEFTLEGGFHFCTECGTKSQQHGTELVSEFDENLAMGTNAVTAAIRIKQDKKKGKMLTSWEVINYILLGYTDRLVALGAGNEFKLTVLQLWATYLRRIEVAFFSKDKPERPRLDVFHKTMDAVILYNRKIKKPKRRQSAESSTKGSSSVKSSSTALTKKVRSEQRSLLNAEYDSFIASQQSDVNRSLHELSVRSLNASLSGNESETSSKSAGQRIVFSRRARTKMKRKLKMQKGHIEKHESDVEDTLKCHGNKHQSRIAKRNNMEPECLTRTVIVAILGLALNVSRSQVQLADLMRFYREEHILTTNLMQYIPEEVDIGSCIETLGQLQKGQSFSHRNLQKGVARMLRFLNVKPATPNLSQLCKRYLEELCLPQDLMIFLDRLLAVFPPKMLYENNSYLPNYESRAMAFIIFLLKLLFGCNGFTEMKMSKSAAKFNAMIKNLDAPYRPVFVFREWIRYLEMRKVILAQVHHPTNRLLAKEEGVEQDATLFIDHNMRKRQGGDMFRATSRPVNHNWMAKLKDLVTNMVNTHHRLNANRSCPKSIEFEPSLTPSRSYFETFLLVHNHDGRVHVPEYMNENHSDRTVVPLITPSDLKQLLRLNHQITLKTKSVPSALCELEFIDQSISLNVLHKLLRNESPFLLIDDCDESTWTPPPKRCFLAPTHEKIFSQILLRNTEENEITNQVAQNREHSKDNDQSMTDSTIISNATARVSKTRETSSQDSIVHRYQNTTHSLLMPNYEYWVRFYPMSADLNREQFDEEIAATLPDNFRLVMEECARIVEDHPSDLYKELMTVEAYLFYAVQPVERFFDGTSECKVQFETNFNFRMCSRIREAMARY